MERAAARGFDVDAAVGDVIIGVFIVGQGDRFEINRCGFDDFRTGFPVEQVAAEFCNDLFAFATNQMVGQLNDKRIVVFIADFRPADDNFNFRANLLKNKSGFVGDGQVPDVDAEQDDFRVVR